MSKKVRVKTGDVFLVPITDDTIGIGRVAIAFNNQLYIVIYEGKWCALTPPKIEEVPNLPIAFASLSQDAKLWHGDWPIIGNVADGLENIATPVFRVLYSDSASYYVETLAKDKSRPATEKEVELLTNRISVSPMRLEKALKALYGVIEWHESYDKLRYSVVLKRSKVVV